jgi:hypothetical protein
MTPATNKETLARRRKMMRRKRRGRGRRELRRL